MPERIVRSPSLPKERRNCRSLLLFSTFSQDSTRATCILHLQKSSKAISAGKSGVSCFFSAFFSGLAAGFFSSFFGSSAGASRSISFWMSRRGNSAAPLCTVKPSGSTANGLQTESHVLSASSVTPSCSKMRSGVRGITKPIITATRRTHSASVYSTVFSRG